MSQANGTFIPCAAIVAFAKFYFSDVLILVKLLPSVVPNPLTAARIVIEMPAAISAYSMAVAADSSFKKRIKIFIKSLFAFLAYGIGRRDKIARRWVIYPKETTGNLI